MKLIKNFSLSKRIASKLSVKKQIINRFGLKMPSGYGWIRNPKKFVYNKVYNKINKSPFEWLGL